MALYLAEKTPVNANDLSPKEATFMSRDIKYIGMDVHKEAIVIAVLSGGGKRSPSTRPAAMHCSTMRSNNS
jgi:hypothetical protein